MDPERDDGAPGAVARDDDSIVSRVIPRDETDAAVDYWTPERMAEAQPD